jgi:hypothetical protein
VRWLIMLQTDAPGRRLRPVVEVNLAERGASPASYADRIAHFAYLRPDYVVIYDDLGAEPVDAHRSRIFSATGYAPALPLVLIEKGMSLSYGSVEAGYDPRLRRETSWLSHAVGRFLQAVGSSLVAVDRVPATRPEGQYADMILNAVITARGLGARVAVAVGPALTEAQRLNRDAVSARLAAAADESVVLVDLTAVAGLAGADKTLDGYNYSGEGRVLVAEAITPALLAWIDSPSAASQ